VWSREEAELAPIVFAAFSDYCEGMAELKPDPTVSTEEEVDVDAETAAAIERDLRAADEASVISSHEVRRLVPQWISKFSTPNQR
jgi:hypothetical protein